MRRCNELAISCAVPEKPGTFAVFSRSLPGRIQLEERKMPVLILWAVPALIVLGGGIYLIGYLH
ncbi:hypothetical protein ACVWYQ_004051 [Bradyrhizobium sp. USDA 3397]